MLPQVEFVFALLVAVSIDHCYSTGDIEYGLEQAQKVAKGICWIEKLNKPYPANDGSDAFADCKKGHDYVHLLGTCQNDVDSCLANSIGNAVTTHLSDYDLCLSLLQDANQAPTKDYGQYLGDSEKNEYPYKGYTHCLLEIMENRNGQQGLDDLWEKWENPKSLAEAMLERENEHRSWHSSPPLGIDEELSAGAQSWADQLAEGVCRAESSQFSNNPDRKYNGLKTGENVADHADLMLSDDEMGVIAAVGWYKETELYPWPLFNGSMSVWAQNMVGHFTQSVWRFSKRVGYGISRGTPACQKLIVVARYWPYGNRFSRNEEKTRSDFELNVLPRVN